MQAIGKEADKALLLRLKISGDRTIIGILFKKYSHIVTGLALHYLKDRDLSKDAAMDIFEFLVKNVHKYDIDNFKSWLLTLTRNHCLKQISRSINKENELIDKNIDVYSVEYNEEVDHTRERQLIRLEEALSHLKKHQQECLTLFYLRGKSYEEIVDITNYDVKMVKSYIQNGKLNLRNKMT